MERILPWLPRNVRKASGTISGALTGTVTDLAGHAEANVSGEDPFAVTFF
jgi:hypothetical protein